jgi:hypothetical protein
MRRLGLIGMIACLAALLLTGCGGGGGGSSEEGKARHVLEQELAFAQMDDFRSAYALFSPQLQAKCTYDAFVKSTRGVDFSTFKYADMHVVVSGDHATADYTITNGSAHAQRTGDALVKIDGTWFDDADSGDSCASR